MKKILTVLISGLLVLSSCESTLDIAPEGRQTLDQIFSSEITVGAYMNGCYQNFPQSYLSDYFNTNNMIGLSDDAYEYHTAQMAIVDAYKGALTPSNNKLDRLGTSESIWSTLFRNIDRCNVFLSRIDGAPVPSEEDRERWRAEIRVLRAYYYLDLMGRFGEVPIFKEPNAIDSNISGLRKNTFKECVDFLQSECRDVIENSSALPWRITAPSERQRMTKAVAAAIMSRSIVWLASPMWNNGQNYWSKAEEVTKYALDKLIANDYELYTVSRKPSIFGNNVYFEYSCSVQDFSTSPIDKETILCSSLEAGTWWNVQGTPVNLPAKVGLCPTQELVDAYPMTSGKYILDLKQPYKDDKHLKPNFLEDSGYDEQNPYVNRDPRFYATVLYNGCKVLDPTNQWVTLETYNGGKHSLKMGTQKNSCTGYHSRRYYHPLQRKSGAAYRVGYRLMDLDEMYLNYAEAAAENNNLDAAIEAVKPIRDRVSMPNIVKGSQEDVILEVKQERRIEMAYQDNRYYDIRRWVGPDDDIPNGKYSTGMWIEKTSLGNFEYRRFQVGDTYNKSTDSWAGSGWERKCFTSKYKLYPIRQDEADKLNVSTGISWQNPGW